MVVRLTNVMSNAQPCFFFFSLGGKVLKKVILKKESGLFSQNEGPKQEALQGKAK
jgi:hypothetical protein